MTTRWTEKQLADYERLHGRAVEFVAPAPLPTVNKLDAQAEKQLHNLIMAELNRREIEYVHAPMHKKSTLPKGFPDFAILAPGKLILCEVKTPTGKVEAHQEYYHEKLKDKGYQVEIVRSFEEFLRLLK